MATLPWCEPPADLDMARPFWDAIEQGRICLPRCSVCGGWQWYPEAMGTDCEGGTLEWHDVALTGTVYAFTRVHRSFLPGASAEVPYLVGLIDLDRIEGPRLVAPLVDEVTIGDRVAARFVPHGDRTLLAFGPPAG